MVKQLDGLPHLKKNIQIKLNDWHSKREEKGALIGARGAQKARLDIKLFNKKKEDHEEELLMKFI